MTGSKLSGDFRLNFWLRLSNWTQAVLLPLFPISRQPNKMDMRSLWETRDLTFSLFCNQNSSQFFPFWSFLFVNFVWNIFEILVIICRTVMHLLQGTSMNYTFLSWIWNTDIKKTRFFLNITNVESNFETESLECFVYEIVRDCPDSTSEFLWDAIKQWFVHVPVRCH